MTFGEYMKTLRKKKGLSQRELSELSKVSNAEISRLETGERKKPSPNAIKAIAPFLGVTYEKMMEQARYIEKVVPRGQYEDVVWEEKDGTFVDTYRREVANICRRDSELISILDRAVDKSSDRDIDTIKKLLSGFIEDGLTEDQKLTLKTVIESFKR